MQVFPVNMFGKLSFGYVLVAVNNQIRSIVLKISALIEQNSGSKGNLHQECGRCQPQWL